MANTRRVLPSGDVLIETGLSTLVGPDGSILIQTSQEDTVERITPTGLLLSENSSRAAPLSDGSLVVESLFSITPVDVDDVAPVLSGVITVSALTTTSYTLTWDAASDDTAVVGYLITINGVQDELGNVTTVNVSGRTSGSIDSIQIQAFDAALNLGNALTVDVYLKGPKVENLFDAFSDGTVNTTLWTATGSATEADGQLTLTSNPIPLSSLVSNGRYDLLGSALFAKPDAFLRLGGAAASAYVLELVFSSTTTIRFGHFRYAGTPDDTFEYVAEIRVNNGLVHNDLAMGAGTETDWLRIRESAGVLYFETADGALTSVGSGDWIVKSSYALDTGEDAYLSSMTAGVRIAVSNTSVKINAINTDASTFTDTVAPDYAGGDIVVTDLTTTSYTLTWNAATDNVAVTGYEYSLNGGSDWIDVGNVLTVNVTGRAPGTTDNVQVRAYDAEGNPSDPISEVVGLLEIPRIKLYWFQIAAPAPA